MKKVSGVVVGIERVVFKIAVCCQNEFFIPEGDYIQR